MHRFPVVLLIVILNLVFSSGMASAQNMLTNPDFDSDLTGWEGSGFWDPEDAFGSPASGSASWINDWPSAGSIYQDQCLNLPPDFGAWDLAGYVYIPAGQPVTGRTYVYLGFYSTEDCSEYMENFKTDIITDPGAWVFVTLTDWTPIGAVSARVGLANYKDGSPDFQVHQDTIFFGRSAEWIFADGFESGDFLGWGVVANLIR